MFWAVRAALGSSWTRGSFVILFCSICLTGARCETLRRFGSCCVCWVALQVWPLYFFRSLGVGALRNAGTMVTRTVGASKGERCGRRNVSAGQLRRGFLEDSTVARKKSATLGVLSFSPGDTSEGVVRRESGLESEGSRTFQRLAICAGQFSRFWLEVLVGRRDALFSHWSVCLERPGVQRWDTSIAASVGVALPVWVAFFLSFDPDIVWRGALEDLSLALGDALKVRRSERRDV